MTDQLDITDIEKTERAILAWMKDTVNGMRSVNREIANRLPEENRIREEATTTISRMIDKAERYVRSH